MSDHQIPVINIIPIKQYNLTINLDIKKIENVALANNLIGFLRNNKRTVHYNKYVYKI